MPTKVSNIYTNGSVIDVNIFGGDLVACDLERVGWILWCNIINE